MDLFVLAVQILIYKDIIYTTLASIIEDGFEVPTFIQEPSSKLLFSNNTGSQISCSARGNPTPQVTWVLKDGTIVNSVPGLRQTPGNGSLYFPPFLGQYFRSDVHEGIYRCRASNAAGTILSRDVNVRAVTTTPYDIWIDGKEVFMGNVAFLRCFIPENVKDFVSVTSWYRGDEVLISELSEIGGRYIVTSGSGDLYIRSIKYDDNLKSISCLTTNSLNGEHKRSESIQLSIKEISTNMAPRTNQLPITHLYIDRGNDIHLPCNIQGNPLPSFTWYRLSDNGNIYPVPSSQRIIPSQTILLIKNADERDSGKWICTASNQFGDQKIEIRLYVNTYLSAHIHPQIQIVNSGGTAIFNCSITGTAIDNIEWFHDGTMIIVDTVSRDQKIKMQTPTSLVVNRVGKDDRGIYQCLISNKKSSAQAMAELKLGDIIPELIHTFIEQNTHPGQHISLKCSATGSPPPEFTWSLDSQLILDITINHRYAIGQFVDTSGDVIGHLNISSVRSDDGGLYKCVATNSIGHIEHSARLNVYGPPYVRAIGPIKSIAGNQLMMYCPYSGYPIESISWEKSRQDITSSSRYEIANINKGGYLKINQVDSSQDTGIYTCIVRSEAGEEARRDIQLTINSPPVIEAFSFPRNLQEGGRAQVTCAVSSGDMPVYFSWKKNGIAIPMSLQITEKKDEFFTLLVFKDISARHSGKYTCYAMNSAATVNYTSELLVRVAPKWIAEPKDTAIMLGTPLMLNCQADGYPEPTITWFKGNGKSSKEFKSILLKNNSLIIDFATELDEGFYMCQASNGIGTGLKKIIHINVNEPARFDNIMKNISSKRNDPITLSCLAKGDEPINIIWSHNNARIDLNNYRITIAEMKNNDGVKSQLSISRTDRQDSGIYKCLAENSFGKSEHIMYLAVQERPDTPSHLEIIEVNSRSIKLSWRRPFDGNSPVLSYIVQYQPLKYLQAHSSILNMDNDWNSAQTVNITLSIISESRSLDGDLREKTSLSGLHPSTTYLLRMLAVNEIERSSYTEPIVIKTQEEAPTDAPQNVQVQTGNAGELIVTWQLPSKDSWNGELLGFLMNYTEDQTNTERIINKSHTINNGIAITKIIKIDGWATTKTTIRNLKTYRKYAICVRATNNFGSGPCSAIVYGTTMEGVPEASPRNVNCTSLSSQSIKISWQEPPIQYHGGILQGYKILYTPLVEDIDISSSNEVKRTSNLETYLHALYKATNYSIRVLAFTSYGDGLSSNPVYCRTEEDVPEPPADIKAVALTADSILVAWLAPKHKNGHILQYTVYSREFGRKGQPNRHLIRVDEYGNPVTFQARNLQENQQYEFWVSASTVIGEGEPTAVVAQSTITRAPAKIASFSQTIRKPVGTSLVLECMAVGNPTPRAKWFTRDRPVTYSPFYEITPAGNLKIHSVEPSLSGNYTCTAKNLFGEDQVNYRLIAMKHPNPPQIIVQYASSDSIRISWESADDGGAPIQSFTVSYRTLTSQWFEIELTPENTAHTIMHLKCGTQYIIKMSANNRVGVGHSTEEINVWTKGKKPQEPEQQDLIVTNATCINLKLTSWINGGCTIFHFSIEHRPLGDIRWTVVSSDISNSEESRNNLIFCDLLPATWYQLRISATNEGGKTTALYNFATTNILGERIPTPEFFPENDSTHVISLTDQSDWLPTIIVLFILFITVILIVLVFKHRGTFCGPISDGYESRTIPLDLKDEHDRRNQVYTASPVKTVDKSNDSEMYEISPYATFSVSGGRTPSAAHAKTPTRGITTSTLDYTVQFKTFGHPEGENLNATAYPILSNSGAAGFGHIKGKSSWPNQRYYNTDDESTLSKSMTVKAGHHSQIPSNYRNKTIRESTAVRSKSRNDIVHHPDSESDTSGSPINEFSNTPTYRVPIKSSREIFQPDSSTESNNDHSPVEKRTCTPRHVINDVRIRSAKHVSQKVPRESQSMDVLRSGSNNSSDSEVNLDAAGLRFRPPSEFTDSREFSETECDRDRALDLEVQQVMENNNDDRSEELTSLLQRYQEKKEKERLEYTIHV